MLINTMGSSGFMEESASGCKWPKPTSLLTWSSSTEEDWIQPLVTDASGLMISSGMSTTNYFIDKNLVKILFCRQNLNICFRRVLFTFLQIGIFYILKYCSFHSGALTAFKRVGKSAHLTNKNFIKVRRIYLQNIWRKFKVIWLYLQAASVYLRIVNKTF